MFIPQRVINKLFGGVGFEQTPASLITEGYPSVTGSNLDSLSGLTFQSATSFITIQNIYDVQQAKDVSEADFNVYLTNLQKDCILSVVQKIVKGQSLFNDSVNLYPFEKSFKNTLDPGSGFVGFNFYDLCNNINTVSKVSWIELVFDSAATFNIYLYNSNKPNTPVKTQSVTTVANESVIVELDGWYITDNDTHKGGETYVGYFEADLGGAKAIKRDYESSNYEVSTPNYYIAPVTIESTGSRIDVTTKTEIADTYGLNIGVEVYTDYTELIVRNRNLFWDAIQMQMSEKVLKLISSSIRNNSSKRHNKDALPEMQFEVYGNAKEGIEGLTQRLERTVQDIKKALFYKPRIINKTRSFTNNVISRRYIR